VNLSDVILFELQVIEACAVVPSNLLDHHRLQLHIL
jgi:hypothetical protein